MKLRDTKEKDIKVNKINPKDIVKISGINGPEMKVISTSDQRIVCGWFLTNNEYVKESFSPEMLEKTDNDNNDNDLRINNIVHMKRQAPEYYNEIYNYMRQDQKIKAIKLLREVTGCTLRKAKDEIELFMKEKL